MDRIGDWMQTATGRKFWPLDPRPEDVDIEDIAHALSNVCRFGGHCREFYSVAEHSVRVSDYVGALGGAPWHRLAGLLHDATEAYLGDMIRPLKIQAEMVPFRLAEGRVEQAIRLRFSVVTFATPLIKTADEALLATEARDIMGGESAGKWQLHAPPLPDKIDPWISRWARIRFLERFAELTS